jgi:hypothetical protein
MEALIQSIFIGFAELAKLRERLESGSEDVGKFVLVHISAIGIDRPIHRNAHCRVPSGWRWRK